MAVPPSIKKFLGTWKRDDQNVEYTVSVEGDRVVITGVDTSDGEELRIQDVAFDGSELRFTTVCVSTVFSLRHIFRSVHGNEIEHQFTLTEIWVRKSEAPK
jgi:hypothetical protein